MATPTLTKHLVDGSLGPIAIDIRSAARDAARPVVLILHGFKGFKTWGMFPSLAERLARAGFAAVSINLSGSGVDDAGEFVFPDRFGHNTFSAELADIGLVLDALDAGELGLLPPARVGLLGHSRGGGMAILAAAGNDRISALVTWAAISHVDRWPKEAAAWRAAGKLDVVNSRTGQVLPLYPDVLDDVERYRTSLLNIQAAAGRITAPWLLLHGTADPTIPVAEAELLAAAAEAGGTSSARRTILLPGADHTFGAVHPFLGPTPELAEAIDETVKWFGRHL